GLSQEHYALEHHGPRRAHRHGFSIGQGGGALMLRTEKEDAVKELKDQFERMSSAVFIDYKGMSVEEVGKLRDSFRQKGVKYKVVKNTLVKKALANQAWAANLSGALQGMTGVAWSFEEPSAAARIAKEFA